MSTATAKLEAGDAVWVRGLRFRIQTVGHYIQLASVLGHRCYVVNGAITLYNGEWHVKSAWEVMYGDAPTA